MATPISIFLRARHTDDVHILARLRSAKVQAAFAMLAETTSPGVETVHEFWMRERLALSKRQGGADR